MAKPNITPPHIIVTLVNDLALSRYKANPDATIATTIENPVHNGEYIMGMPIINASIPIKCMDQIPAPIAKEPPINHILIPKGELLMSLNRAVISRAI